MSNLIPPGSYEQRFELGDWVNFNHGEHRLHGRVVRAYNSGDVYHVEVKGERYEVDRCDDCMSKDT